MVQVMNLTSNSPNGSGDELHQLQPKLFRQWTSPVTAQMVQVMNLTRNSPNGSGDEPHP